jgi:LacI family transcriptional regulator
VTALRKKVLQGSKSPMFAFLSIRLKSGREKLSGIYRYANEHRRQVKVFDGITTERQLKTLLKTWNPCGCLVESSFLHSGLSIRSFAGVPTVFQGLDPLRYGKKVFLVQQDAASVVAPAVKELVSLGFSNYAYIGTPERFYWDESRRISFKREIQSNGGSVKEFDYSGKALDSAAGIAKFRHFLSKLPKPCGVFCAADYVAQQVLHIARTLSISVPGDMAIVGVDDDELICENTEPKLTSVLPDFERGGYLAAKLLDEIIANPKMRPQLVTYGPRFLVSRASSTRVHSDYRVASAIKFIREHATERIEVSDVVAQMKCGRRFAERHFRSIMKMSILDMIRHERFEIAFRYLSDPRCPIDAIPVLSGYSSLAYMKTVFKKKTGKTMREWRKENCADEFGVRRPRTR